MAMPICLRLLVHWARRAASRAACTAGSNSAISTPMIAMTTSSSISVNPRRARDMDGPPLRMMGTRELDASFRGHGEILRRVALDLDGEAGLISRRDRHR